MKSETMLEVNNSGELLQKQEVPQISRVIVASIPVSDVEIAKAWYSQQLGIDFASRRLHTGNINIGFSKVENHTPASHSIIIWQTSDLAHAHQTMKDNGVTLIGEINWSCRYFVFADQDGNRMTMWQQDEEAIFRLTDVKTPQQLQDIIKRALFCTNSYGYNWAAFEEELLLCETIRDRKIVLKGWHSLQAALPEEARMLKECVQRHNAKYPSHEWLLEVKN